MTGSLHLVRFALDQRGLARVAIRHGLSPNIDSGYFLHAGLAQLFARSSDAASVPLLSFAVDEAHSTTQSEPSLLYLLAYSSEPAESLVERMGDARQEILHVCKSREMPAFRVGQRMAFRTRVCPIVRTKVPGARALRVDKRGRSRSREIDVFVHATLGVPRETAISREDVYRNWLGRQLESSNACSLDEARLVEFRREVMHRKGGSGPIERPNAVFEGALTVADPTAFGVLLARGLGRHRAFGFGMLLLKPA